MNKRYYEHTLPIIRGSLSNTYVRSGLSGNCVRSILQDSIGYMWFATQDGLNRFNGIEFTNYGHSSENGGNSYMNIVTICRHQDNNQIWVASTEKLYLFDSREEKFSVFDTQTEDGVTVNSVIRNGIRQ